MAPRWPAAELRPRDDDEPAIAVCVNKAARPSHQSPGACRPMSARPCVDASPTGRARRAPGRSELRIGGALRAPWPQPAAAVRAGTRAGSVAALEGVMTRARHTSARYWSTRPSSAWAACRMASSAALPRCGGVTTCKRLDSTGLDLNQPGCPLSGRRLVGLGHEVFGMATSRRAIAQFKHDIIAHGKRTEYQHATWRAGTQRRRRGALDPAVRRLCSSRPPN